jgi:GNAT superfamily N-acetyltransferase
VLALDLADGLPYVGETAGVTAHAVTTAEQARRFGAVNFTAWDAPVPDGERIAQWLHEYEAGPTVRVLADVDGEPASCAGVSVIDGVARLWGGATVPELRGRGAYRAVLRERLRIARERGATLALVKGRVDTSGPILSRAGFTAFDQERAYLVAV